METFYISFDSMKYEKKNNYETIQMYNEYPKCKKIKNTEYSMCYIVVKKEYYDFNEKVNILDNLGNYHAMIF